MSEFFDSLSPESQAKITKNNEDLRKLMDKRTSKDGDDIVINISGFWDDALVDDKVIEAIVESIRRDTRKNIRAILRKYVARPQVHEATREIMGLLFPKPKAEPTSERAEEA